MELSRFRQHLEPCASRNTLQKEHKTLPTADFSQVDWEHLYCQTERFAKHSQLQEKHESYDRDMEEQAST